MLYWLELKPEQEADRAGQHDLVAEHRRRATKSSGTITRTGQTCFAVLRRTPG